MDNSRKSIPSSSKHEELMPNPLQHQHPVTNPTSFNSRSFMQTLTFPAPMTHEEARYLINYDGYIVSSTVGLSDRNQTFQEKPIILEIPNGFDIINCVTQFAQRYKLSITVLCGNELISEVDFMYPRSATPPVYMSGCYHMVSFSGTYSCLNVAASGDIVSCFTVSLIDAEGKLMGGLVASTIKAASNMTLVVSITNDLS